MTQPAQYFNPPKAGKLTRLLWFCAGADAQLLEICPHSDQVKYQGLGGVVLATAVLAFCSGGYAFYTVFLPKDDLALSEVQQAWHLPYVLLAVVFGLLWSAVIFNLDRFIVSSAGKGDGKEGISWEELKNASPRLFLALIIGLTISKPLEIRIMESEIEAQLELEQQNYLEELDAEADTQWGARKAETKARIDEVKAEIQATRDRVEKLRAEVQAQSRVVEQEVEGSAGTRLAGRGPAAAEKKEHLARLKADFERGDAEAKVELERLERERDALARKHDAIDQNLENQKNMNARRANNLDGLVRRMQIADEIGPWIGLALTALFIMVEIAPILFKLMLTRGAYDFLEVNQKLLATAQHGIELDALFVTSSEAGKEVHDARYHNHQKVVRVEQAAIQKELELSERAIAHRAAKLQDELDAEAGLSEGETLHGRDPGPDATLER